MYMLYSYYLCTSFWPCFCSLFGQIISAAFGLLGFVILTFWFSFSHFLIFDYIERVKNSMSLLYTCGWTSYLCMTGAVGFLQCTRSHRVLSWFPNLLLSPPATQSGTVAQCTIIRPRIDTQPCIINIIDAKASNVHTYTNALNKIHVVVLWFQPLRVSCGECLGEATHCASFGQMLSLSPVRYKFLFYVSVYIEMLCVPVVSLTWRSTALITPKRSLLFVHSLQ